MAKQEIEAQDAPQQLALTSLTPATAITAGYKKVQLDRGASSPYVLRGGLRFATLFEKWLSGEPGRNGFLIRAWGEDASSAANADTAAVGSLNAKRRLRYGTGANTNAGALPGNAGFQHTIDVT
jgi:hypothetical protein